MLRRLTALILTLAIASPLLCCCLHSQEEDSNGKAATCCQLPDAPAEEPQDCDCDAKFQHEATPPELIFAAAPEWKLLANIEWTEAFGLTENVEIRREFASIEHGPPGRVLTRLLCVSLT